MLQPRRYRPLVLLCLFAGALSAHAAGGTDVYKWRDADGKMVYGDRPPQGVKAEKVEAQITTVPAQINTPNPPMRNTEPAKPAKEQTPIAITGATRQQLIDTCVAAGGTDCDAVVNKAMEEAVKRQSDASRSAE